MLKITINLAAVLYVAATTTSLYGLGRAAATSRAECRA